MESDGQYCTARAHALCGVSVCVQVLEIHLPSLEYFDEAKVAAAVGSTAQNEPAADAKTASGSIPTFSTAAPRAIVILINHFK